MTEDGEFTKLIGSIMSNRQFYVELNGMKSRWRNQKNGLPQGIVLSSVLFNVYTNDQHVHNETHSFIYVDDLYYNKIDRILPTTRKLTGHNSRKTQESADKHDIPKGKMHSNCRLLPNHISMHNHTKKQHNESKHL